MSIAEAGIVSTAIRRRRLRVLGLVEGQTGRAEHGEAHTARCLARDVS